MTDEKRENGTPAATLDFHMMKSNFFRVAHADGVFGGITPQGNIHIAFFSERTPLPQVLTHAIDEQGSLGPEVSRTGKTGVVREVEVDVVMNANVAKALRTWLDEKLAQLRTLEAAAKDQQTAEGET